jgi:uncharacterized membrane protein
MSTPTWALTLAYWFHMLATVVWIGGLATLALLILPVARRKLDEAAFASQLESIQSRLDLMGWFCLATLIGTGLVQMSGNPNYEGFFEFGNLWSVAILLKHIVFVGMIAVSAYITWGVIPKIRRIVLYRTRLQGDAPAEDLPRILSTNQRWVYLNLGMAVVVLACTAVARALS